MGSEMDISMCYIHTSYGGGYKVAKIYSVFSGDPQFSLHFHIPIKYLFCESRYNTDNIPLQFVDKLVAGDISCRCR